MNDSQNIKRAKTMEIQQQFKELYGKDEENELKEKLNKYTNKKEAIEKGRVLGNNAIWGYEKKKSSTKIF